MDLPRSYSIQELADILGREYQGDPEHPVRGINEIHRVRKGDLVFVDHPKYYDTALQSAATTILIDQAVELPDGKALILSQDPFSDLNVLTQHFDPYRPWIECSGEPEAVGEACVIHPSVHIADGVRIGRDCRIEPGVVLGPGTVLGDRVVVQANSVIGSDAFYYKGRANGRQRMHSCGWTELQDDVEIGAACTIDRGVTDHTRIGAGSKLDNQVHIGHDTLIGKNCVLASQVGISGCVNIEDEVVLWGQVGIIPDVTIGKGAELYGQAGVSKDLEGGKAYLGSPAEEAREKFKQYAALRGLTKKG
ncbi:MAG: LpxD N-terminal domain-containing protein [Flavobacteriales bacterium]